MLRAIISIYSALVMVASILLAIGSLATGVMFAVSGDTQALRSFGFSLMMGGPLFAILLWGNVAIMVDNNRLLRRIAGEESNVKVPSEVSGSASRREPTFSGSARS